MIYGEVFADQIDRKQVYDSHTPKSGIQLWSDDVLLDHVCVLNKWLRIEELVHHREWSQNHFLSYYWAVSFRTCFWHHFTVI